MLRTGWLLARGTTLTSPSPTSMATVVSETVAATCGAGGAVFGTKCPGSEAAALSGTRAVLPALTALPRPGRAAAGHRRGGACPSDARPTTNAVIFARRAYLCDTGTWTIATAPG